MRALKSVFGSVLSGRYLDINQDRLEGPNSLCCRWNNRGRTSKQSVVNIINILFSSSPRAFRPQARPQITHFLNSKSSVYKAGKILSTIYTTIPLFLSSSFTAIKLLHFFPFLPNTWLSIDMITNRIWTPSPDELLCPLFRSIFSEPHSHTGSSSLPSSSCGEHRFVYTVLIWLGSSKDRRKKQHQECFEIFWPFIASKSMLVYRISSGPRRESNQQLLTYLGTIGVNL